MTQKREYSKVIAALFAAELKAQREAKGWTQEELGIITNYSTSLIAALETKTRKPQPKQAAVFDEKFGLPGTFQRLEEAMHGSFYPIGFAPFTDYEAEARVLRIFEPSFVTGLFQTEQYARAVLETQPNTSSEQVNKLLEGRLLRQATLDREHPPLMYVLLDESVLHRPVAEADDLQEQFAHVLAMAERPNITVQVVPCRASALSGSITSFTLADTPDSTGVVYLDDGCYGRVTEESDMLDVARLNFEALRSAALPSDESRDMIEKVASNGRDPC